MQILNRSTGDMTHLGDKVRITVVEICGDRVKLGFDCPSETPVYFEEIYVRNLAERSAALRDGGNFTTTEQYPSPSQGG